MVFEKKILENIKHHRLVRSGDKILVGVSGGADSIALLCVLNKLRTLIGFQIHVGHINHHLRKTADRDQNFVKKFCAALNLPCTNVSLAIKKKLQQGGSAEEIARTARLQALAQIAKKIKANKIALAHQSDDLAETVLLRLLRGTGLQGLQAILPCRKINGHFFIRPLLAVSRSEIGSYLKKNKISYRTDPTNAQTRFFRNKVRRELLPLLERRYQKNIKQVLCHIALTSTGDYEYLRQQTVGLFPRIASQNGTKVSINLKKFKILPVALKRMTLRLAVEKIKGNTRAMTLAHFLELEDLIANRPSGSIVDLPDGLRARKTKREDVAYLFRVKK